MLREQKSRGARRRFCVTLFALGFALGLSRPEVASAQSGGGSRGAEARASEFRQRAKTEMEAALGAPIKLNQDAINAAYLSAGWKWGQEERKEWDDAAFRRAFRWGFRIEDLSRVRHKRFTLDSLSAAPIRAGDVSDATPATPPARKPLTLQPSLISTAPEAEDPSLRAEDETRIQQVEARLAVAQRNMAEIERRLLALESDVRSAPSADRSAELRAQIGSLKRMLEESSSTVSSVEAELEALTRDISVN